MRDDCFVIRKEERISPLVKDINFILFIFTDETNTAGDASSASMNTGPKIQDWATQVDNAEQQEADYDADNLSQTNSSTRETAGRSNRGPRRRNTSQLLFLRSFLTPLLSFQF